MAAAQMHLQKNIQNMTTNLAPVRKADTIKAVRIAALLINRNIAINRKKEIHKILTLILGTYCTEQSQNDKIR